MPLLVQSPSFLDYQKTMEKEAGKNNARSLFGIHLIPGANQIILCAVMDAENEPAIGATAIK